MCFITIIGQLESISSKYWAYGTWYLWERKFRKFWNRFWFILCLYRICILLRRICCECSHIVGKLVYPRPRLSKLVPAFTSTADIWKPAVQSLDSRLRRLFSIFLSHLINWRINKKFWSIFQKCFLQFQNSSLSFYGRYMLWGCEPGFKFADGQVAHTNFCASRGLDFSSPKT